MDVVVVVLPIMVASAVVVIAIGEDVGWKRRDAFAVGALVSVSLGWDVDIGLSDGAYCIKDG